MFGGSHYTCKDVKSMSCPFYWWNNHFACRKSGKDVSEDIYYKYCRNYDYGDCPIYKQQNPSDSRCFLTTACIRAKNLPDNCTALMTLRSYRDTYLLSFEEGKKDVQQYYQIAPLIVLAVDAHPNTDQIYAGIYENLIVPCVKLIAEGNFKEAHQLYKDAALALKEEFLPNI